jgi:hypothetical protein
VGREHESKNRQRGNTKNEENKKRVMHLGAPPQKNLFK